MNTVKIYAVIVAGIIVASLISELWQWYTGLKDDTFDIFDEEDV